VPLLDDAHCLGHSADVAVRRSASAGHEADPLRPSGDRSVSGLGGLRRIDPVVLQDISLRTSPLRAVRAVLRTQAALHVDDEIQLHAVGEEVPSNAACCGHYIQEIVVRAGQDGESLGSIRYLSAQRSTNQILQCLFEFDSHEANHGIPNVGVPSAARSRRHTIGPCRSK
jgi:hypothetical protein